MNLDRSKKWYKRIKLPLGVIIAVSILPAVIIALFYALRGNTGAMVWATTYISAPIRRFAGMLTSVYPFSMMEILIIIAALALIYFIVRTIMLTVRRRGKWKILGKRALMLVVTLAYVWGIFCWLWNVGYHAPGFAQRNGFTGQGINSQNLTAVTRIFAQRANELSLLVERDDNRNYVGDRRQIFAESIYVFDNISEEFPCLGGRIFRPKPMIFSFLMSRMGYGGVYFAITGEANINTQLPYMSMPVTVVHEHAHTLGVFAEDEANFVAILASITSENIIFEYSGYLFGLMHLMSVLQSANAEAWQEISQSLYPELIRDWNEISEFWKSQRLVETGVGLLDRVLTNVTETMRDSVDSIYDAFLRANEQELGLLSYGAWVDLIIEYFVTRGFLVYEDLDYDTEGYV